MASSSLLRSARLTHLYFGTFIAPALLFFAFTGALQTFNLHETTRGSSYVPPRWAVVLGQIHKKQTSIVPDRRPPAPKVAPASPEARPSQPAAPANPGPKRHPLPLKIFFLVVSVGLLLSALTGIYMAYKYTRSPAVITLLLVAGTLLPIALVFV